jgi:uncharacterized protein (DUF2147 family)
MKNLFLILVSFFMLNTLSAQADKVTGIWYNTEKTSKFKIFKATNGKYYAKIVWLDEPDKKDVENPDEAKKDVPLMGMRFLNSFTYDNEKNQWLGGTIYDPGSGKTYDCYMWFEENENILHVKGYVMGMKFAGKKVEWSRTEM